MHRLAHATSKLSINYDSRAGRADLNGGNGVLHRTPAVSHHCINTVDDPTRRGVPMSASTEPLVANGERTGHSSSVGSVRSSPSTTGNLESTASVSVCGAPAYSTAPTYRDR